MEIPIRLFAEARQRVGCATITIELPEHATVADLKRTLAASYPALEGLMSRVGIAIDSEYAEDGQMVRHDAEIAVIPPVSGGLL